MELDFIRVVFVESNEKFWEEFTAALPSYARIFQFIWWGHSSCKL